MSMRRRRHSSLISLLLALTLLLSLSAAAFAGEPAPGAKIELKGEAELTWVCGEPWHDPGFSAVDAEGKGRTGDVTVEGEVIPWRPGDYELRYVLGEGDEVLAEAVRLVHVEAQTLPETVQPPKGTICLTFDDGPCAYTEEALEVLGRYGVKATFFVVTNQTKYLHLLPKIVEQGHTLGIHCNDHGSYEWLYKSEKNYFTDLMTAQEIVHQYTGQYAHVVRFPGGSRTASFLAANFPDGYEEMYRVMHDAGVRAYDWNVQPESSTKTTEGTFIDFSNPREPYEYAVVLQHDARLFSVKALERMIEWALGEGYTFAALDETYPEVHFQ